MLGFLFLVSLLIPSWAAPKFKVGDVLLQPLDCSICTVIEEEEATIYSHIGVVISTSPEVLVAEALGRVRPIKIEDFNRRTQSKQNIKVIRSRLNLEENKITLLDHFMQNYNGKKYDAKFLWDDELLYCSELVAKIYADYFKIEIPLKRMHFEKNRALWFEFFKGEIPDHEWGISPADFDRSDLFLEVGEI